MLKEKILELRSKGFSYRQIANQLKCSRSTIGYWCRPDQKEKVKRNRQNRLYWKTILTRKINRFKNSKPSSIVRHKSNWKVKIVRGVKQFCDITKMKNWGSKQFLEKFGTKTVCYLTGREIDLIKDNYNFDHIVPVSKGGTGDIDNLGITVPIANRSKSDMTLEEYLDLCEEVLRYHGRIK